MENNEESRLETLSSQRDTDRVDGLHSVMQQVSPGLRMLSQNFFNDSSPSVDYRPSMGPEDLSAKIPEAIEGLPSKEQQTMKITFLNRGKDSPEHASLKKSLEFVCVERTLTRLPSSFETVYLHLKSLDLRFNSFTEIPDQVFSLINLRVLRMDGNLISSVPAEISMLTCLQILTLSKNYIHFVHPEAQKLAELSALVLSDNAFEEWPEPVGGGLAKLRLLHLHGNPQIVGIPLDFCTMEKLQEFSFDWFLYVPSIREKLLKGAEGLQHIAAAKHLCKLLLAQEDVKTCDFMTFLQYFLTGPQREAYPLHTAARLGHDRILSEILGHVDVNLVNDDDETALAIALRTSSRLCALVLLKSKDVNLDAVQLADGNALHVAIKKGWYDVAEQIMVHGGLDPNARDLAGSTALHLLFEAYNVDSRMCGSLCRKLVEVPFCDCNSRNKNNLTPLQCAARKNQREAIRFALAHNARGGTCSFDFNAVGGKHGFSVLHYLVIYSTLETIKDTLAAHSASGGLELFARDGYGRTARDLVKNSVSGKLLLKHEKICVRRWVQSDGHDSMSETEGAREAQMSSTIQAYGLFGFSAAKNDICGGVAPSSDKKSTPAKRKRNPSRNVKLPDKKAQEESGEVGKAGHENPGVHRPSASVNMAEGMEETLMGTQRENMVTHIRLSKAERLLIQNRYSELYHMLQCEECARAKKYRILFYVFSQLDREAEEIFVLLREHAFGSANRGLEIDSKYLDELFLWLKGYFPLETQKMKNRPLKVGLYSKNHMLARASYVSTRTVMPRREMLAFRSEIKLGSVDEMDVALAADMSKDMG